MARYFRLLVDPEGPVPWNVGPGDQPSGQSVDPRRFTCCESFGPIDEPIHLVVKSQGDDVDFHFGSFDMPVLERQLGERMAAFAVGQLELVPALVEGSSKEVVIANALASVDCLDEARTVGEKWLADAGRPDKLGQYRTIVHLRVDPARIDADIFRVQGWKVALVVSDRLANETGLSGMPGIRLLEV